MAVGNRLSGRVAIVTGAGSGIGHAVSVRLAEEGARVACLDVDRQAAAATADDIGSGSFPVQADVADEDQVKAAVRQVAQTAGALDVLVSNAGVAGPQERAETTPAEGWDRTHAVNLRGVFLMAKHALAYLVPRQGTIVNIASALAFVAWPSGCAYGPSKAGVVQLTKGLALDYAPAVRVNCVCPGAVRTPMITSVLEGTPHMEAALADYGQIHPLTRRLALPREIADAVLFLASDDASFITGAALPVDGGFLAGGHGA
jgi:NAD(P)-dependent dehydrogenase (short-subunit alcohol dehydrogenase family)